MTTPASVWRQTYITSRLPYSSGTTGQICSAPFVLNKALGTATANADRPFEIANGLITDASYSNIIPIAVPPEYAILETWMVVVGTHEIVDADTTPVLSIYGKTSFGDQHSGNMPDDYTSITDWPENLREWWMPLPCTDRTTPASTGAVHNYNTGVRSESAGGFDASPGSGSFDMSAYKFTPRTIPVPGGAPTTDANPQEYVAKVGDGTGVGASCFPAQTFFLNGADTILTTVNTALDEASSGTNFDGGAFLMGRFHG